MQAYLLHLAALLAIYTLLTLSLNLMLGLGGLLSVGHGAAAGFGAYFSVYLSILCHLPVTIVIICGSLAAALVTIPASFSSSALRKASFPLYSFAVQMLFTAIVLSWLSVTGGARGISGVPSLPHNLQTTVLLWIISLVVWLLLGRMANSPIGTCLKVFREDELLVAVSGRDVRLYRALVLGLSSGIAGLAGALLVHYLGYVSPSMFDVQFSIFLVAVVIVGGVGSTVGSFAGAILMVVLPEALRFVGVPAGTAGEIRQVCFGLALVALVSLRPTGLWGSFDLQHAAGDQ
jgi:branched-chain amino acid transport system permease protein